MVETHDGRPTKMEGNPDHPNSLGAATALAQATLLNLYDPDRSAKVPEGGQGIAAGTNLRPVAKNLTLGDGSGLRFLSERSSSPSLCGCAADVAQEVPKGGVGGVRLGILASGWRARRWRSAAARTRVPAIDKAKVILSLDADFLGLDSASRSDEAFAKRRRVGSEEDLEKMNRLYVVESQFSLTGANADHRLRMKGAECKQFAAWLWLAALGGCRVAQGGGNGGGRA